MYLVLFTRMSIQFCIRNYLNTNNIKIIFQQSKYKTIFQQKLLHAFNLK